MIIAYMERKTLEPVEITAGNEVLLDKAIWIDLVYPSKAEEEMLEAHLKMNIPTSYDIVKIGLFSYLYEENNVLFMTAIMIDHASSIDPKLDHISFVLTPSQLITTRYIEPQSFKVLIAQLYKLDSKHRDAISVLVKLLDLSVDGIADLLQIVGHGLDEHSRNIFKSQDDIIVKVDYKVIMQQIGANGDLNSKVCESLVTLNRLITFFRKTVGARIRAERAACLAALNNDLTALSDHANFISDKVSFLLNATLGMVNIEQNQIIKTFSVVAVIFMPPTLVASIYGMNFRIMPELQWEYGYAFGLCSMLLGSWLPYKYFKYKKWM